AEDDGARAREEARRQRARREHRHQTARARVVRRAARPLPRGVRAGPAAGLGRPGGAGGPRGPSWRGPRGGGRRRALPAPGGGRRPSPRALRVAGDDPEYGRMAVAEAEYWSGPVPYALEALEERFADGPVERYTNARFTGDRHVGWHQTIARRGPFRRGLVL